MRTLVLTVALGIASLLLILPSVARAGARHGAVVVASPGAVVVVSRAPVVVVRPVHPTVIVAPRPAVVVASPVPFAVARPFPACGRWWWDGWRWLWIRTWC